MPNQGTLQITSWEQGYKNYIDRKYDMYESADRDFYNCLAATQQLEDLKVIDRINKKEKQRLQRQGIQQ
jgi:hypothetical protein